MGKIPEHFILSSEGSYFPYPNWSASVIKLATVSTLDSEFSSLNPDRSRLFWQSSLNQNGVLWVKFGQVFVKWIRVDFWELSLSLSLFFAEKISINEHYQHFIQALLHWLARSISRAITIIRSVLRSGRTYTTPRIDFVQLLLETSLTISYIEVALRDIKLNLGTSSASSSFCCIEILYHLFFTFLLIF